MKTDTVAKVVCVLAIAVAAAQTSARASTIIQVTDRASLGADKTFDWAGFGAAGSAVASGASFAPSSGLVVTVSTPEDALTVDQEGLPAGMNGSWMGDFAVGQSVLTNWGCASDVTIWFSQPVFGAGVQIEPGQIPFLPAAFTAYVTAYDGNAVLATLFTTGVRSVNEDDSAPFLGVFSDKAQITSLSYRVNVQTSGPATDVGINFLSIVATVPEPSPLVVMPLGLALCLLLRRRLRRCPGESQP